MKNAYADNLSYNNIVIALQQQQKLCNPTALGDDTSRSNCCRTEYNIIFFVNNPPREQSNILGRSFEFRTSRIPLFYAQDASWRDLYNSCKSRHTQYLFMVFRRAWRYVIVRNTVYTISYIIITYCRHSARLMIHAVQTTLRRIVISGLTRLKIRIPSVA